MENKKRNVSALPTALSDTERRGNYAGGAMIVLGLIGLWGCLLIYGSHALGSTPFYFVGRQLVWLFFGLFIFYAASKIPFRIYVGASRWLFYGSLVILGLLFFSHTEINGMKGWFQIGAGIYLQPSEFAKISFLLFLCKLTSEDRKKNWKNFGIMFFWTGLTCVLILLQPDFGSATLFFLSFLMVYWIAGGRKTRLLLAVAAFSGAAAAFLCWKPYAWNRILAFWDPEDAVNRSSWHIKQFQYALAQGGLTGSDAGGALWANAYLPLPHSDSLFAAIVEAAGAIGGLIVLTGFLFLAYNSYFAAKKESLSDLARKFIFSIGCLYVIQAFLHIGVNVVLLPPTGVTLPILSYGGSSLFSVLLAFGIASSACRSGNLEEPLKTNPKTGEEVDEP